MKTYEIKFLPEAIQDIIYLKNTIIKKYNDTTSADIVISKIFSRIETLNNFPNRTEPVLKIYGKELRLLKAGKYTIVYHIEDKSGLVKIYGVFHSRRDIFKLIKNR